MRTTRWIQATLAAGWVLSFAAARAPAEEAKQILAATGVKGGLIVHIGCGDGKVTAALRANDSYLVHGLDTDAKNVAKARKHIRSKGLYGPVSVDTFDGKGLPYVENLVNLIVSDDLGAVTTDEVMRVLCPGGVAYLAKGGKWAKTVKPWPADIDEWTHYLHGADGNPVAQDRVVGPPKHYQWVADPVWMRSHESDSSVRTLVTARGRLFYIVDEAPISLTGDHPLPDKWSLAARDAFNGVMLWKVPIKDWGWRTWKHSWFATRPGDMPLNIEKRLVAVGDKVYVTLGYRAAVSELDAKTGAVLKVYKGTERTGEILHHAGTLVLSVLREGRVHVAAVDARSGKQLWITPTGYIGTTTDYIRWKAMRGSVKPAKLDPTLDIATDGKVVAFIDGMDIVGVDFKTGKQRWRTPFKPAPGDSKAGRINARGLWTGTLIVKDGVVVHASPYKLAAFSAKSGKALWSQPKKFLGHLWYEWKDVFVIGPLVWTWSDQTASGKLETGSARQQRSSWPVSANGYDLHTGKLSKKVPLGPIFKTHHHHRCYRDKATVRYILASRRGTEFVDLEKGKHTVNNWVRGTCHVGMMPANGLQYAPPHPCRCYIEEKLTGFNALAAAIPARYRRASRGETGLLERGPAYGKAKGPAAGAEDWPQFRHDATRSGAVKTKVPPKPTLLWRTRLGSKPAPPVVVGQKLFVPLVDEHHLVSLNVSDGRKAWELAAGGRIDSPPTYYRGSVIFGSADGWVYCVRASDGQLAWRYRAGPEDRRMAAFGQLESVWPVHGSVLVREGIAYFAAGRSSYLDGGIRMCGLDAVSGAMRHQTKLDGPHYRVDNISQNYLLPMGALPDILQSVDALIYMRDTPFNTKLEKQKAPTGGGRFRLKPMGGFLDGSYFKRIPWSLTPKGGYARLIVHDQKTAYHVRMFDSLRGLDPKVYFTPGKKGYLLFAVDKQTGKQTWAERIPIRVKAMVAAEGLLFVAGPPDVVDPKDPLGAFEGRKGGLLWVVSAATGEKLAEYKLDSPPVFNGIAAASGRLYVATAAGEIICFGAK